MTHIDANTPEDAALPRREHGPNRRRLLMQGFGLASAAALTSLPRPVAAAVAGSLGYYNVKDYGAIGDGKADDTPAIQNAILAAQAAGGGTVLLPGGNYWITSPLVIKGVDSLMLQGLGRGATKIQPSPALKGLPVLQIIDSVRSGAKDLTILGNSGAAPLCGVQSLLDKATPFSPTQLTLINADIGSPSTNSLQWGVRWDTTGALDQNNDFGWIENVGIATTINSAYRIGHSNSLLHTILGNGGFYSCGGGIELHGGSFHAYDLFFANNSGGWDVDFQVGTYYHQSSLSNCTHESKAYYLRSDPSASLILRCFNVDFFGGADFSGGQTSATPIQWGAGGVVSFIGCILSTGQANTAAVFSSANCRADFVNCDLGLDLRWAGQLYVTGNTFHYGPSIVPLKSGAALFQQGNTGGSLSLTQEGFTVASAQLNPNRTPTQTGLNDGVPYELGMKFKSTKAHTVTALRFWKDAQDTGTHTGHLWSAGGKLLASVVFTGETASGWQQQSFPAPAAIAAGAVYTVSVNTNGYYSAISEGLVFTLVHGDISTVADSSNGVYGSVSAFPAKSYNSTDYLRDIVVA